MLTNLKRRYPKLFSTAILVGLLGGIGGIAAYEKLGGLSGADCCAPGASCCFPGSPCCNGAHKTASK